MTKAEKIAEAFGRGLAQGLVGSKDTTTGEGDRPSTSPIVVPVDAVRKAVEDFLTPMMEPTEQAPPTASQLDMFTHGIEDVPADPQGEMIARRVAEARERAEREGEDPHGTFRPDMPGGSSSWIGPNAP